MSEAPTNAAERRICVDADCPNCGWPERWYSLLHSLFGCSNCDYTSQQRES